MTHTETLKLALEALNWSTPHEGAVITHGEAITDIKAALAQLAQNSVNQTLFGYEIFGCFFRDFDGALNAFKNQGLIWATPDGPFNGMNEDWLKKNIREVYVHGTSELERLNQIGNGGPINAQAD